MMKPLQLRLSRRARRELAVRNRPLTVVMELYFSCLLRKRVLFPAQASRDTLAVECAEPRVSVFFLPVMSSVCKVAENQQGPPLTRFPIQRPQAFKPKWLRLDFHAGHWQGEYGFD